jgi:hypothetical protein
MGVYSFAVVCCLGTEILCDVSGAGSVTPVTEMNVHVSFVHVSFVHVSFVHVSFCPRVLCPRVLLSTCPVHVSWPRVLSTCPVHVSYRPHCSLTEVFLMVNVGARNERVPRDFSSVQNQRRLSEVEAPRHRRSVSFRITI